MSFHRAQQFFLYERDPAHGEFNLSLSEEVQTFLREHAPSFELKWKITAAYLTLNDPHAEVAFRMQFETVIVAAPTHHW